MADRDIVRGDIGATERLIEYDSDEERVVKLAGAMILDCLESPLATNALLLAMLLWMIFHGRIQRLAHRAKRVVKKLLRR